jgi:hypothetical protein
MASRRARIMDGMGVGGGTEAPRRRQIREALGQARKQPTGPGGQTEIPQRMPRPQRFPQVGGGAPRQGSTLSAPVKLGAQLQGRVQSGAIDQTQAQTVARQRAMLQKAFGADWRKQVFGAGGAKGIQGPFAQRQVAAKRAQGLERAKRKLY